MIVTDSIKYIPFTYLDRTQVGELLGKGPSAVDYYVRRGARSKVGDIIYLQKETNGKFLTENVIKFITSKKK
jgi:predicted transcriptional regulator